MKKMVFNSKKFSSGWISIGALLLGALSLILVSPKWVVPAFAWVAPCFFLYFTRMTFLKRKWIWLWVALLVANFISIYEVFPMPLIVAVIFTLIDAAKNLLIFVLDRKLTSKNDHFITTLFFPAAMVTKEFIDASGGAGVWGSLANTQFEFSWLAQLASVTGLWGISFMVGWFASFFVWMLKRKSDGKPFLKGTVIYSGLLLSILVFGALRFNTQIIKGRIPVKVAGLTVPVFGFMENMYEDFSGKKITINPKLSQSSPELQEINRALVPFIEHPDTARFKKGFVALGQLHDSLFVLSQKAADAGAKIISWSEGNGFILKQQEKSFLERGKVFAEKNHVYLLMAMAIFHPGKIIPGKKFIENEAVLIGPDGNILNTLHKNKPVPIIENSEPGDGVIPVIATPFGNIATSICYDADFPGHMQQLGKKKSDLLLLPSGDWYAISPYHSYMAAMRGIENGCSVMRQVSGGLSVVSDYRGKIESSFNFFNNGEKLWMDDVQLGHVSTIYSRIGDIAAYLCVLLTISSLSYLVIGFIKRKYLIKKVKQQ
jgi:apolipoprotein N-acyltransferase